MKNLIIIFILALCATMANAQVKVLGKIEPNGPTDTYPTHVDSLGRGGFMAVKTWQERNSIPLPRRKAGMMVSVKSATVDSLYRLGVGLSNADWSPYNPSVDISGKANADGSNATGTWPISISGNAAKWGNVTGDFASSTGATPNYFFGYDSPNSRAKMFEISGAQTALGINQKANLNGGNTFTGDQSVTGHLNINAGSAMSVNITPTEIQFQNTSNSGYQYNIIPPPNLTADRNAHLPITGGVLATLQDIAGKASLTGGNNFTGIQYINNELVTSNSIEWGTGVYEVGRSKIYNHPSQGTVLVPKTGVVTDFVLTNGVGGGVFEVPTGTINTRFSGNIGFNTSNPTSKIHVISNNLVATNDDVIKLENNSPSTTGTGNEQNSPSLYFKGSSFRSGTSKPFESRIYVKGTNGAWGDDPFISFDANKNNEGWRTLLALHDNTAVFNSGNIMLNPRFYGNPTNILLNPSPKQNLINVSLPDTSGILVVKSDLEEFNSALNVALPTDNLPYFLTVRAKEFDPSYFVNFGIEDFSALTSDIQINFQPKSGNVALTSDIPKMLSLTASGDGVTGTFQIAHGLSYTPTMISVTPNSKDAAVNDLLETSLGNWAYADATYVYVVASKPDGSPGGVVPVSGVNNLKWTIMVK